MNKHIILDNHIDYYEFISDIIIKCTLSAIELNKTYSDIISKSIVLNQDHVYDKLIWC